MKKTILVFGFTLCLVLSVAVVLNAGWWVYTVTEPTSSSCSTPSYGDELNEGFLGTGYENTWTESGTGTTLDEDVTLPGSPPTDCCDEGLKIEFVTGNDHTYWDRGTSISYTTTINIVFYIYFDTLELTDDYEGTAILIWDDDTTHALWSHGTGAVEVVKSPGSGTGYFIRGRGNNVSSGIEITTGTWYRVTLHLDTTADSSYIQVDNGTQQTFTREDVSSRYLSLGLSELESGDSLKCYIGYVYIDTP